MPLGISEIREDLIIGFMKGLSVKEVFEEFTGLIFETRSICDDVEIGYAKRASERAQHAEYLRALSKALPIHRKPIKPLIHWPLKSANEVHQPKDKAA